MHMLLCCLVVSGVVNEPFGMWTAETVERAALPPSEGRRLSAEVLEVLDRSRPVLPFGDLTCGIRLEDGTLWVGSDHGLMYLAPDAPRWRLFHSRRWLPDDHVLDLAVTSKQGVFVQTPAGIGRLYRREMTLDEKMAEVHAALRAHHLRFGLVGEIRLNEPGTLEAGYFQPDSDNDGLWTCLYVAAEAFRYAVTGDAEAKQNAWQSIQALMFLEEVTGIPGFAARSILPIDHPKPESGEWHRSADGKWWWKGDTSSDEIDGHYFAHAVYYDLAATDTEREQIRGLIERMTDHILDHGLYYVGPPGKPTTWGVWAPEKLNHDLQWLPERGLNSLEILSHLKVAEHIVGKPRYREVADELIKRHAYATNTVRQKILWPPELVNHSDDELAFLAYYPLLIYERDPELRKYYLASIERSWQIERPERSPLFNYIYAAARQASRWTEPGVRPPSAMTEPDAYDSQLCVQWFRDVPLDLVDWTVRNSGRRDLGDVERNRFGRARAGVVLPVSERRQMRWNGDPYALDGGSGGTVRDDGTFILLPYWMGRYHRFLE